MNDLDNCCCNCQFDDQAHVRICLETMAKMRGQAMMRPDERNGIRHYALCFEEAQP